MIFIFLINLLSFVVSLLAKDSFEWGKAKNVQYIGTYYKIKSYIIQALGNKQTI